MTIVFNGIKDYVRSILIFFNSQGYADYDYEEDSSERKPNTHRKPTKLQISTKYRDDGPDIVKPDIFFDLNARETIYNDLCYRWHLSNTTIQTYVALDKLNIDTTGGLFRIIWMRRKSQTSYEYEILEEHAINMKNIEYYWIRSKDQPQ